LKKKFAHKLEYALVRISAGVLARVPESAALAIGRLFGSLAWRVVRFRRSLVLESLRRAFPEKGTEELAALGLACYRNLGSCFVEMFRIHRLSTPEMERRIFFERRRIMDQALEQGRGVINVTFHYGNWELMGAFAARSGMPLDVIVRGQQNPYFDRYVKNLRLANGMRLIPVNRAKTEVARSLRSGRIVSFLADQDAHRVGVFIDFLGRPASTPKGPALYAFKTGAPVVLSIMLPQAGGRWKIVFEPVPRPDSSNMEEFIREMTACYTNRLEYYVRQTPEHWFWPHRRWKTEPYKAVN
jgi:KDO2-lipid IV(A) lauroyltransferase